MIINPYFRGLICRWHPLLWKRPVCAVTLGTWFGCLLLIRVGWAYLAQQKGVDVIKIWLSCLSGAPNPPFTLLQAERSAIFIQHRCFPFIPEANFFFFLQQFWWNYVSLVIIHFKNSWAVWRTFMKIHLDKIRYYCLMRWHFNLDLASCIYQEFFME